jgi:OFA family oxalate/formate antiporter-like MFS transporter
MFETMESERATAVAEPSSGQRDTSLSRRSRLPHAMVAILTQFLVSLTYAYSVFRTPLAELHGWSKAQTVAPYECMLLMVSLGSVLGGAWQDRKGPRIVATVGGIVIAAGCGLAAIVGNHFGALIATFGIVVGFGVGLVYVTPIANLIRWFPDKRGEVVGFAVMGSGFSALFWAPLLEKLIGAQPSQYAHTIPNTFLVMAGIFLVAIVGLAQLYRVPPKGWKPDSRTPRAQNSARLNFTTAEMLRQRDFYALYALFVLGTAVGQTTIGNAAPLLQSASHHGNVISVGFALGVLGICNALGRLGWGTLSDLMDRRRVVVIMSCVSLVACLGFLRAPNGFGPILVGLCLAVFAYSGFLAIMPAFSADYFGSANVGANYGLLFTAWGVSGFIAPGIFERMLDHSREMGNLAAGYNDIYVSLAAISLLAMGLVFFLRPPATTTVEAEDEFCPKRKL